MTPWSLSISTAVTNMIQAFAKYKMSTDGNGIDRFVTCYSEKDAAGRTPQYDSNQKITVLQHPLHA
jgi:hypothetical protein